MIVVVLRIYVEAGMWGSGRNKWNEKVEVSDEGDGSTATLI